MTDAELEAIVAGTGVTDLSDDELNAVINGTAIAETLAKIRPLP